MSTKVKKSTPKLSVEEICNELRVLQRHRAITIKSRNMQANRLQAIIAGTIGYTTTMTASERKRIFKEATAVIKSVHSGEVDHPMKLIIDNTMIGIDAFNLGKHGYEKEMVAYAKQLPVADWVLRPEQRGFGLLFLAIVIGETGNLSNYANPGKLWKRFGCAPFTKNGETLMGATWKSRANNKKGLTKLTSTDWEEQGYSPRRRSIAYLIGEGVVKANHSIYRARWLEVKTKVHVTHPEWEWKPCTKCKGEDPEMGECLTCGGLGETCGHAHKHGMLLATKLLLKNLWIEWQE